MAKMIEIPEKTPRFCCYSERGILSYFMFRYLPDNNNLNKFLKELSFPEGCEHPFKDIHDDAVLNAVYFSEFELGKKDGFGCPDGAIYFSWAGRPMMILLEGKFNETYLTSCKKKSNYNSTIQGQLELRWYAFYLYLKEKSMISKPKITYLVGEKGRVPKMSQSQASKEELIKRKIATFRRVRLVNGVGKLFSNYVANCNFDQIFFLCVTDDPQNPFDNESNPKPNTYNVEDWEIARTHFCWINSTSIEEKISKS